VLFANAKHLMRVHGLDSGWGILLGARGAWDGRGDCLQQFCDSDVVGMHGAWHDTATFHAGHPGDRRGWFARLQYTLAASLVNRRVAHVRQLRFPVQISQAAAQA